MITVAVTGGIMPTAQEALCPGFAVTKAITLPRTVRLTFEMLVK